MKHRVTPRLEDRIRGAVWGEAAGSLVAPGHAEGDGLGLAEARMVLVGNLAEQGQFDIGVWEDEAPAWRAARDLMRECPEHLFQMGASIAAAHWIPDERWNGVVDLVTEGNGLDPRQRAFLRAHFLMLQETMTGGDSVDHAAGRVVDVFEGQGGPFDEIFDLIDVVMDTVALPLDEALARLGQGADFSELYASALYIGVRHGETWSRAVEVCRKSGPHSDVRAAMVGAWLGAAGGMSAVSHEALAKVPSRALLDAALDRLIERVGRPHT